MRYKNPPRKAGLVLPMPCIVDGLHNNYISSAGDTRFSPCPIQNLQAYDKIKNATESAAFFIF